MTLTADTITDEQIRELRAERHKRTRGGNATLGKVYQHFPPLVWTRDGERYVGTRRGFVREYAIRHRGNRWYVARRYEGDELAITPTYKAAKQWAQLLADGEIKDTPEWREARARCAEILNARAKVKP